MKDVKNGCCGSSNINIGFTSTEGQLTTPSSIVSDGFIWANNIMSGFIALATIDETRLTSNSSETQYYSGAGKSYYLPSVTTLPLGARYTFINGGTGDMSIFNFTGEIVGTVPPGEQLVVMLIGKNFDVAASWFKLASGGRVQFAQTFSPTLYTTGPSTYTSQMGSWTSTSFDEVNFVVCVNFRLIISAYETDSNTCTFLLPFPGSTETSQFVSFTNIQGSSGVEPGSEYSPRISFGSIFPGSNLVVLHTNYTLAVGDLWVGNFVYNAIL